MSSTMMSSTIVSLQKQSDTRPKHSDEWKLSVFLYKGSVVIFHQGDPVATREKWVFFKENLLML